MRFGQATVQKATRAEFDEFRKNGPPNLISREQYHSFQGKSVVEAMGLKQVWPSFARNCWALQRFRIPDDLKQYFAKLRPATAPRYWGLSIADETPAITRLVGKPLQCDDGGKAASSSSYPSSESVPNFGIPSAVCNTRMPQPTTRSPARFRLTNCHQDRRKHLRCYPVRGPYSSAKSMLKAADGVLAIVSMLRGSGCSKQTANIWKNPS